MKFFFIVRKLKAPAVPATVLECAPETCTVYVISNKNAVNKSGTGPRRSCFSFCPLEKFLLL